MKAVFITSSPALPSQRLLLVEIRPGKSGPCSNLSKPLRDEHAYHFLTLFKLILYCVRRQPLSCEHSRGLVDKLSLLYIVADNHAAKVDQVNINLLYLRTDVL